MWKTKYVFVYHGHFKNLHEPKCYGYIIDNIPDALIRVLEDNNRGTKLNLKHPLKNLCGEMCTVE